MLFADLIHPTPYFPPAGHPAVRHHTLRDYGSVAKIKGPSLRERGKRQREEHYQTILELIGTGTLRMGKIVEAMMTNERGPLGESCVRQYVRDMWRMGMLVAVGDGYYRRA